MVFVRAENHGSQPVYLSGSVSFDRDDVENGHFFVVRNALGAFPSKRTLAPGDGFDVTIAVGDIPDHLSHIKHFFFQDELRRVFETDEAETRAALREAARP